MSDHDIRSRLLDTDESFCVTAPAGSGKTSVLTQRVLSLLAKVDKPEQVLAITFTRKAASEMKARVLAALSAARKGQRAESEHEQLTIDLAAQAIAHGQQSGWEIHAESLNIKTIDGLCGYLSRGMPLLSGLGGSVGVVEDARSMYREAIDGLYSQLSADNDYAEALKALLLSFNNDWQRLSELLLDLLSRRADWLHELGQHLSPEASEQMVRHHLERNSEARLQIAIDTITPGELRALETVVARARARVDDTYARGADNSKSIAQCPEGPFCLGATIETLKYWQWLCRLVLTGDGKVRKRLTASEGFDPEQKADKAVLTNFLQLVDQEPVLHQAFVEIKALPLLETGLTDWQGVLQLSRVLPLLSAQLLTVFQKYGQVDYAHIAIAAEDALGPDDMPTDLALRLDYQISHILVDEFQDTSLSQFRLLERLCRGWQDHNADPAQAKRTLFLVGDAMQSIYGFRHANVSLFVRAGREGVAGVNLINLALTMNFRSQAGLVNWVNEHFETLLPKTADLRLGAIPQTKAVAHKEASGSDAVEIRVFPDDRDREALWVANRIATLKTKEPTASIAVLGRSRPALQPTVQAILARGLEINGSDLTALDKRPVINDLLSLCRYLANPADLVAFLGLLRSPLCGLTASEVETYWQEATSADADNNAGASASDAVGEEARARLEHLQAALAWAEAKRDRLDLAVWVELSWLKLGGAIVSNDADLTDAEAFFTKLRSLERAGQGLDIDALSRWTADAFSSSEKGPGAIQVMTLHKSKGLEFDYVFIVGCGQRDRSSDRALLHWHRDPDNGFLIAANTNRAESGGLYDYLHWMQKTRERYESIRLYYVGITRAKVGCWLSGTRSSETIWPPKPGNSVFGQLCETAERYTHYDDPVIEASEDRRRKKRYLALSRLTLDTIHQLNHGSKSVSEPDTMGSSINNSSPADNLAARRFGTIAHRGLELLADMSELPKQCPDSVIEAMKFGLLQISHDDSSVTQELSELQSDLNTLLATTETRWALEGRHGAHNEFALWLQDEQRQIIIDRTFIDTTTGIRWVIDYKSSSPAPDQGYDVFLNEQADRYRSQLKQYGEAMRAFDAQQGQVREVKTALLFSKTADIFEVDI